MNCRLCKKHSHDPVMLLCTHQLCYKCALNIQVLEQTSLIQGKYRLQCPDCRRQTYTYDVRNLLIGATELNLITDSSEFDKEPLHESELAHYDNIFERRESKMINKNDLISMSRKPLPSSEKVSPRKKNSFQIESSMSILNTSNNRSGVSTPISNPFGAPFSSIKENKQPTSTTNKHKRSATGIQQPQIQISQMPVAQKESPQHQIVTSYFTMLRKSIAKVETELLAKVDKSDANHLYTRMKKLSQKYQNDEELLQTVKVILDLRAEFQQAHRKQVTDSEFQKKNQYLQSKLL